MLKRYMESVKHTYDKELEKIKHSYEIELTQVKSKFENITFFL